jgi:hypothetical protein
MIPNETIKVLNWVFGTFLSFVAKKKFFQEKVIPADCFIRLDGLLKAPQEFKNQKTIIK